MCLCVCVDLCLCVFVCVYMCLCVCVCVCFVCIYEYLYVFVGVLCIKPLRKLKNSDFSIEIILNFHHNFYLKLIPSILFFC